MTSISIGRRVYWGPNFDRLAVIKKRYQPEGVFFTHQPARSSGLKRGSLNSKRRSPAARPDTPADLTPAVRCHFGSAQHADRLSIGKEAFPGHIAIVVGSFADPAFPAPTCSGWERKRHHWIEPL